MTTARGLIRRAFFSSAGQRVANAAWFAAARATTPRHRRPRRVHVVMLPAGGGNIGDQAMFEAYLAHVDGPIVAAIPNHASYTVPPHEAERVRVLLTPLLSAGTYRGRLPELQAFVEVLREARTFSVIGADIMDGGYNRSEAVTRSELLNLAAQCGVPSRVLGFSWGRSPDPAARGALRRASRRAHLFARDPETLARLRQARISAGLSADLAFTMTSTVPLPDSELRLAPTSSRTVILNMSGLINRQFDLKEEFAALIDEVVADGGHVILLPHTIRAADDDLDVCRATLAQVRSSSGVTLIDRLLRPAEVRWIAGRADAVITGRMHLAIHALGAGTPAIVLRTRDKVEGLLHMFELDEFGLDPGHGVTEAVRVLLGRALSDAAVRQRVEANLPMVRELAARQFDPQDRR
ncbi:polysaccharide pyruvyl transferase family protein [Microbacterium sp. ASV49]|uniref:Polysaccharide pyruvyl transferase family protein n=1 Tax=Microbacterium candidum TaxID=3041922 RepID=A0ABT7MUY0_9MICO|nr:polysaccharide pyruvyl transferase family protein [Microbacterium sp. ASV49]MDL9978261.1 polysaccharide pyruvyl transferase family protein [Microbacterium sp. ASV49]